MRRIKETISGNAIGMCGVSVLIPKTPLSHSFQTLLPDVEERPGDSERATGLTDVALSAAMLQHAQPGFTFLA